MGSLAEMNSSTSLKCQRGELMAGKVRNKNRQKAYKHKNVKRADDEGDAVFPHCRLHGHTGKWIQR